MTTTAPPPAADRTLVRVLDPSEKTAAGLVKQGFLNVGKVWLYPQSDGSLLVQVVIDEDTGESVQTEVSVEESLILAAGFNAHAQGRWSA